MLLDSTTKLEFSVTSGTAVEFVVGSQNDSGTAVTGVVLTGQSNGSTAVDLVPAPAASNLRRVLYLSIRNGDTIAQTVTVRFDVSATDREICVVSLAAGERLEYTPAMGWRVLDSASRPKSDQNTTPNPGKAITLYKVGTAPEAAASWYGFAKDGGNPGAWTLGSPGLGGATVSLAGLGGDLPIGTAAANFYLKQLSLSATVAGGFLLYDLLWYNTGLVVTTTTGQTINSVAFPARDQNGSTDGEGLMIGLYWVAASTNAGAITNATVTYTNQAGTGSRTATVSAVAGSQIPITPVIGTIVWFNLQAGDTGVRSIQTITLGTSLVTGTVSAIVARWIAYTGTPSANIPAPAPVDSAGARLFASSSLYLAQMASAATATVVSGVALLEDR